MNVVNSEVENFHILNFDRKSLRHRVTYQIHLFVNSNKGEIKTS